jgi:hypothetical protein
VRRDDTFDVPGLFVNGRLAGANFNRGTYTSKAVSLGATSMLILSSTLLVLRLAPSPYLLITSERK